MSIWSTIKRELKNTELPEVETVIKVDQDNLVKTAIIIVITIVIVAMALKMIKKH